MSARAGSGQDAIARRTAATCSWGAGNVACQRCHCERGIWSSNCTSGRGLPSVCAHNRRAVHGESPTPARSRARVATSAGVSGRTRTVFPHCAVNSDAVSSDMLSGNVSGITSSNSSGWFGARWANDTNACSDSRSASCASSTVTTAGPPRWPANSPATSAGRSDVGERCSSCSATPQRRSVSHGMPVAASTCQSCSGAVKVRTSVDLPIPGGPCTSPSTAEPARASSSRRASSASSRSRPTTMVALVTPSTYWAPM